MSKVVGSFTVDKKVGQCATELDVRNVISSIGNTLSYDRFQMIKDASVLL